MLPSGFPPRGFAKEAPASKEQLRQEVEEALRAKNEAAIRELFYVEGVTAEMQAVATKSISDLLANQIQSVSLQPLPEGFHAEVVAQGFRYHPSVPVLGFIRVDYSTTNTRPHAASLSLLYGSKNGRFYLPGTVKEKVNGEAAKKSLSISIFGDIAPNPVRVEGECMYIAGGEQVRQVITGTGGLSKAFWGDYVDSCQVRRISDAGWFQLIIAEDGTTVFESQKTESGQPVLYQRRAASKE